MTDQERDDIAARLSERLLATIQTAERLARVETQTNRIASDLDSEKATRARANEKVDSRLEALTEKIAVLAKSNWTAAGAIAAALVLWDVAKHFIKF